MNSLFPDNVVFSDAALDNLLRLDGSLRKQVIKKIIKVAQNPRSESEGGYGKPLIGPLCGYMKIKFRDIGVRCVYRCIDTADPAEMHIVIIGMRKDDEVYIEAEKRVKK